MTIDYELIEEDYVQFNLHYIEDSSDQRKMYWLLRILIPVIFCGVIYFIGTAVFNQPSVYWTIISIGFFGLWVLYFPEQYRKIIIKQTRKMLKKGDTGTLFGEKSLTISDCAITVTGKDVQEELKLTEIKKTEHYEDMILIYDSKRSAIIIPRRNLSWDEVKIVSNLK